MANEFKEQIVFDAQLRGFDKVDSALKSAKKNLDSLSDSLISFGKNLSLKVTAPLVALGGLAIKASSDFEEASSKFNTVFRNIDKQAQQVAKTFANDFGQSLGGAITLLGNTGDLLTGFGFAQQQALDLSQSVNQLAVDLASFTNFSGGAEGASQALTKALLGETEGLKSLGIAIRQDDVQAKIESLKATGELTNETERQQKAIATLALAFEQSKNAVGDFARTQDSTANLLRRVRAQFSNLLVIIGDQLRPVFNAFLEVGLRVLNFFNSLDTQTIKTGVVIASLVAGIPALLLSLGLLAKALGVISTVLGGLNFALLLNPITAIIAGITALIALGIKLQVRFAVFTQLFADIEIAWLRLQNTLLTGIAKVANAIPLLGLSIRTKVAQNDLEIIKIQEETNKKLEELAQKRLGIGTTSDGFSTPPPEELSNSSFGLPDEENLELAGNVIRKTRDLENQANEERKQQARRALAEYQRELETLNQAGQIFTNTFTNAFTSIIDGTKSVADAFKNLANNIIRQLTQVALQNAFSGLFAGLGFNQTQNAFSLGGGGAQGFAEGGFVSGAGTSTSDSIPAFLSNGEFVMNARSVQALGLPFLNALNGMKKGFKMKSGFGAYANGGEVQGGSGVVVNVINNSSQPVTARTDQRIDGRRIIIDTILEDLSTNGAVSQTMQNTFGVRR